MSFSFPLQAGQRWHISAGDEAAAQVVAHLAEVMQLPSCENLELLNDQEGVQRLLVVSINHSPAPVLPGTVIYHLADGQPGWLGLFRGQVEVALALARALLPQGGLLLHGALAERRGQGVMLIAPSGTGKTTASRRLPPPWRCLSDDTTLVVPADQGQWQAHPWPTWSLWIEGGPGGHWDVPSAVPLRAIFHLKQAPLDHVEPLGAGQAAARLTQAAEEVSPLTRPDLAPEQARLSRTQRFDWLSALVRAVPNFTLELSLAGLFWQEIEKTLGGDTRFA